MSQILIRVGATRDRSVDEVFESMVSKAKRARSQVAAEARATTAEQSAAWKAAQRELARMEREQVAEVKKSAQARAKAEKDAAKESEREAKKAAKAKVDAEREAQRELEKQLKQSERTHAAHIKRLTRDAEQGAKDRAKAFGAAFSGAANIGGRALRFGASVAADLARATGVRTDLGSILAANADLETSTTNLSNAAYISGDKRNGSRVDPNELQKFAFEKGNATGYAANDVVGALSAFVAKTGDLKTGMESFEKMAQLARATGSEVTDMADAMGDVSNNLGDIPDKANVLNEVMRQIAGQGKLGAVEIKDLATQMAKVASAAGSIEGDAAKNIAELGVFAQEARQRGGAASATQATTAVQGLINTFKTPARVAAFKAQGIDVYNTQGQIRDPKAIMMEALRKVGTDPVAFKKLFANATGGRAVEGFANVYRAAYASATGSDDERKAAAAKAVEDEFARLQKATMDQTEVMESFKKSMSTGQAQANVFNNEMQQTTLQVQKELTPALIAMAPAIISATKSASSFAVAIFGSGRSLQGDTDKASGAVDADLAASNKQFASGTVFQEQLDKNKADAKVLQERINAQRADADAREGSVEGAAGFWNKNVGGVGAVVDSLWNGQGVKGKLALGTKTGLAGTYWGGAQAVDRAARGTAADDRQDADNQQAHLDALNKTNKELLEAVKNGTLKVQVVNAKPTGGPSAPPPTGMQVE